MSSNAFARSRPRVRHQRMPRGNSSCDHPRFLQLVNELARINDLKRKQEEAVSGGPSSSGCSVNDCNEDDGGGIGSGGGEGGVCFSSNQTTNPSICCTAPTLNGYRSLDNNQPASALQDNYHQQHHHHQQQQQPHQHHHQSLEHHQQQTHQSNYIHHQLHHHSNSQLISNSSLHQHRCQIGGEQSISKSSSTSFGYSKQNLVVEQHQQQHTSDVSTNNSDLRQDENRSKRKRTGFDSSASSSSSSSSTSFAANSRKFSSCGGTSKRHKSSSDTIRPLSPSFTKCPICLLDCMDRDPSFTNTCFHLFCYVCIENWTKNKTTCPLCRTKFTKIIFNIKSATVYDEKTASPIRRDDDDGYIANRLMIEHLPGLNSNSTVSSRNASNDEVQFLFANLRNTEVLMPPYLVNQLDPRNQGESLHSFNTVTATTNFNSNVPHQQFTPTSYPSTQNHIALFPPIRIAQPTTNTAIASAYGANTSLITSNLNNNDPSSNRPRTSRSGRYIYTRNYDFPNHDGPTTRVARSSNNSTTVTLPGVAEVRHHHHHHHHQPHQHQQQHPNHHHQHHQHNNQHRSTLDMSTSSSQNQQSPHSHIPLPYPYPPNTYPRRPFNSPQVEQQLLDTLYRQMPEM